MLTCVRLTIGSCNRHVYLSGNVVYTCAEACQHGFKNMCCLPEQNHTHTRARIHSTCLSDMHIDKCTKAHAYNSIQKEVTGVDVRSSVPNTSFAFVP